MKTRVGLMIVAGLWLVAGCAPNQLATNGGSREGEVFGDFGVTGNNNNATVKRGSIVVKLSIIGDKNTITIEEGATCAHIEIWGSNNVVNVPDDLNPRETFVGRNNRVVRYPASWRRDRTTTETTIYETYDSSGRLIDSSSSVTRMNTGTGTSDAAPTPAPTTDSNITTTNVPPGAPGDQPVSP
jgi:hypothetical protein